ncbi:GbsR/MarR family transcriptional regulator [Glutamicibacter creatinolyticus]|uniref:hypothetical protein n=1 Tax=Glutamicibacter creatinolyticus TaxID=162496 RepID=UPI0006CF5CCF
MAANQKFTEELGAALANFLMWPPMAGRISAALMASPKPLTLTELQDQLHASGGAISESTRLLLTTGVIRRLKTPGVRRAQYEWSDDAWVNCAKHTRDQVAKLQDLAERTATTSDGSELFLSRIRDMEKYYHLMTDGLARLSDEYETQFRAEQPTEISATTKTMRT